MTNYVINKSSTDTLHIEGTNNQWFINSDVTLNVAGAGIWGQAEDDGNDVIVYGDVISKGSYTAIAIAGDFNFVHVATGGSAISRQGAGVAFGTGEGNTLLNEGVISGDQFGFLGSNADIEIENAGEIRSDGIAIKSRSQFDTGLTLDNSGSIESKGSTAILGGGGVEIIHNDGEIIGHVKLGASDDQFFFGKGKIDGKVFGGSGNDTYDLGRFGGSIVEQYEQGIDTVISARSYTLGSNLDVLMLAGTKDADGFGNALANGIYGNRGDNLLRGFGGVDFINGGRGDDDLMGGGANDTFVIGANSGRDRILDFDAQGHDTVDLTAHFDNGTSFADLQSQMSQHGEDVWIDFGEAERLILKNVALDELGLEHFRLSDV